jgi:hypothetical protein
VSIIVDENAPTSLNALKEGKPQNTYELILKLQNLYTEVKKQIQNSQETQESDSAKKTIANNNNIISQLSAKNFSLLSQFKNYNYYKRWTDDNGDHFLLIDNINNYNQDIKNTNSSDIPSDMSIRLYLALVKADNQDQTDSQKNALLKVKSDLINNYNPTDPLNQRINSNDISDPTNVNISAQKYIGIDLTNFYLKLLKSNTALNKKIDTLNQSIVTNINQTINDKLGMQPTIYNIFKIICDDVDTFFSKMYKVAIDAIGHHKNYKSIILGEQYADNTDNDNEIFPFPLIINKSETVCGGNREERIAPIDLSKQCGENNPFPEIKFIENFIKSFFVQQVFEYQNNLKGETNSDGTNVWLPLSPIDSQLIGSTATPYIGQSNYIDILNVAINRFYAISQYAIPDNFYGLQTLSDLDKIFIKLYAQSEAVNLVSSISGLGNTSNSGSEITSSKLKEYSDKYSNNINSFFVAISGDSNYYNNYNFNGELIKIDNNNNAEINKKSSTYKGFNFVNDSVNLQNIDTDTNKNPISGFMIASVKDRDSFWLKKYKTKFYDFSNENIIYIKDTGTKGDDDTPNESTRYLMYQYKNAEYVDFNNVPINTSTVINSGNTVLTYNAGLSSNIIKPPLLAPDVSYGLNNITNINKVWIYYLETYDTLIYNDILSPTSTHPLLSQIVLFSCFGNALSPFDIYAKGLNYYIFKTPAIIQIPALLNLYIGACVAIKRPENANQLTALYSFFNTGVGSNFKNKGNRIIADISDCDKYLSTIDKNEFYLAYINFNFNSFITSINQMYQLVHPVSNSAEPAKYEDLLNRSTDNGGQFVPITTDLLIKKVNMAVYNQLTFRMDNTPTNYTSLNTMVSDKSNAGIARQTANNYFFQQFFSKISSEIVLTKDKAVKDEQENNKKLNDKDIINQTYYSFKNINDKWVNIPTKKTNEGESTYKYPFNRDGKSLIDSFVFVDRAMNPIGDTMINAEILTQVFDDPNITVFSVISQLLSLNGFEFFPIQNFMINNTNSTNGNIIDTNDNSLGISDWEDSFKIDTSGVVNDRAAFVCMYIGGTSSYPNYNGNNFKDDGIVDLQNTNASDFNTTDAGCIPIPDLDNQVVNNNDFPYHQVRAFSVRFGQQNQSMFTNIKIDSKEYPETNESIQILSRLAGDKKQDAPIPKGQNLYNLYEGIKKN